MQLNVFKFPFHKGVYYLQKFGRQIHCDMETDGGGWLVIQRRAKVDPQVTHWRYCGYFITMIREFFTGDAVESKLSIKAIRDLFLSMIYRENVVF